MMLSFCLATLYGPVFLLGPHSLCSSWVPGSALLMNTLWRWGGYLFCFCGRMGGKRSSFRTSWCNARFAICRAASSCSWTGTVQDGMGTGALLRGGGCGSVSPRSVSGLGRAGHCGSGGHEGLFMWLITAGHIISPTQVPGGVLGLDSALAVCCQGVNEVRRATHRYAFSATLPKHLPPT